jgi:hypothetical protein
LQLGDKFQGIKDNTARLELGKESLGIDDLQRLNIDCWINDEIINVWRIIMLNRYMNSASNIWIFSSFFFRKLEAWKILKGKAKEDFFLNVRKFYKQVLLYFLYLFIIPDIESRSMFSNLTTVFCLSIAPMRVIGFWQYFVDQIPTLLYMIAGGQLKTKMLSLRTGKMQLVLISSRYLY